MSDPIRAFIGLGANLGDARAALEHAFVALDELPSTRLLSRSSLYLTAPHKAAGPDFFNAVAEVVTTLTAASLLTELQAVELRNGRERPYPDAPRTLDLDLLLYGDQRIATPALTVPHPRLHERAFVLRPLAEIAPHLVLTGGVAIRELLILVADQRVDKLP